MPKALLGEETVADDLTFVWQAFWQLHTDRPLGFAGVGPIPNSAVTAYGDRLGMGQDEAEWFVELIGELDRVYLKWVADQRPTDKS